MVRKLESGEMGFIPRNRVVIGKCRFADAGDFEVDTWSLSFEQYVLYSFRKHHKLFVCGK